MRPAHQPNRHVPVARPYSPPPTATPAKRGSLGNWLLTVGIALVALTGLAIGANFLPARHTNKDNDAPKPADKTGVATPATPEPTRPQVAANDGGDTPAPSPPTPERRADELPAVAPQLPGNDGAMALARLIDREVDSALKAKGLPASPVSSDAEFLRRAYLDLTGHIPARDRAISFLDSNDPYKRAKLIEELLGSAEYGRHLATIWADLLVKRDFDNNKGLNEEPFIDWLAGEFNKNTGWDRIVTEMLTAQGKEADTPQAFFFLANQDNNQPAPEKLVDAVGNLFMGVQIQCSQCHTHPYNKKWERTDFWGMAVFFGQTKFERDGAKNKKGPATLHEATGGKGKDNARVGTIAIPDPTDAKKTTGTAKAKFFEAESPSLANGPLRPTLAKWVASSKDPYFAPAGVNRLWAHFFARGLTHPIEEMGELNPPTHPELQKALADHFTQSGYDIKQLITAVMNSRAYQRSSRPLPENEEDATHYSHQAVKVLGSRELLASLNIATGVNLKNDTGNGGKNGKGAQGPVRFFDTREVDDEPTEYTYGIPQMLKLMNTERTNNSAREADRLAKANNGNRQKTIEDIYLTALARRPRPEEMDKMNAFIQKHGEAKGYAGVFWALLNSAEFVSNH